MEENVEDGGSMDRISDLPKEILYRILYLLSRREAAQTCVLSKSWRFLRKNRLKVTFYEGSSLFNGPGLFVTRVSNALQAHLDHNHRIEEFHLSLTNKSGSISLLENWIPMLRAIGVKELFLSIRSSKRRRSRHYIGLPSVVFKSECLASLKLYRCRLTLQKIRKIRFVRLKVLHLCNVNFTGEHTFEKIISSCPLITTMRLQECEGLKTIKLLMGNKRHKYLKHFTFINQHTHRKRECSIEIHAIPTLERIHIVGSKVRFHGHMFGNLKELSLYWMILSSNSFDCSLCYEFPSLLRLTFGCCSGWQQFDQPLFISAPKILNFRYAGPTIPPISFTTPMSRQCKSEIALGLRDDPQSWFLKLSALLQEVSPSEIFLSVYQNPMHNIDLVNIEQDIIDNLGGGNCKPPVVVEELGLNMGQLPSFPSLLNGMFSICRPRKIAQHRYVQGGQSEEERDHKELTEFLCKFLMKRESEFNRQEDLEGLSIESFDTSLEQWQPTMMSKCGALPESKRIRFRLEWSDAACESSSKRRKLE